MSGNFDAFVDFIKSECRSNRVSFKEYKRSHVKMGSMKCGGFFDDGTDGRYVKKPTLAYAKGSESAAELLVHEYCHMTQWLDAIPLWRAANDSMLVVEDWLGGKEVENIEECLNNARDIELDNEIRAVGMIGKWELPIDIPLYTRKANSYIQFYNYMKESRSWYKPGRAPYSIPEILEVVSDRFDMDYSGLTPELRDAFRKYL